MTLFDNITANVKRLVVVAKFGTVNFRLLLNFLRTINVILPHILPLLQTDVSTSCGSLKNNLLFICLLRLLYVTLSYNIKR